MEFTVNSAVNATEEIAAANGFPDIRLFSGPEQNVDTLNLDGVFNVTHDELFYTRLNWSIATNQSVGCVDGSCKGWDYFSAACWFAVRDLYIELDRVSRVQLTSLSLTVSSHHACADLAYPLSRLDSFW